MTRIVSANDLKEAKNERLTIADQIEETIQEKESLLKTIEEKKAIKQDLDGRMTGAMDVLDEMRVDYGHKVQKLSDIRSRLKDAGEEYKTNSSQAKQIILDLYKNSKNVYVSLLEESNNIFDTMKKLNYVSKIIDSDLEKINDSIKMIETLQQQEEDALSVVIQKNNEIRQFEDRISSLDTSRSGVEREIRGYIDDVDTLDEKTDELREYSVELLEKIKKLQKESTEYVGGKLLWPVPSSGKVVSYFGMRIHPVYKVRKMHYGIDIAASYKRNIVAANDGIVVSAGYINGYGYTVVIDHGGGISTLYAHCSKMHVKAGDMVFKGDLIALIGSTGVSTGPHLHFEVRVNGAKKNPFNYLE
jgi:murein DD-endopeptidase MepM/ murein hydrolase activator NlpD